MAVYISFRLPNGGREFVPVTQTMTPNDVIGMLRQKYRNLRGNIGLRGIREDGSWYILHREQLNRPIVDLMREQNIKEFSVIYEPDFGSSSQTRSKYLFTKEVNYLISYQKWALLEAEDPSKGIFKVFHDPRGSMYLVIILPSISFPKTPPEVWIYPSISKNRNLKKGECCVEKPFRNLEEKIKDTEVYRTTIKYLIDAGSVIRNACIMHWENWKMEPNTEGYLNSVDSLLAKIFKGD